MSSTSNTSTFPFWFRETALSSTPVSVTTTGKKIIGWNLINSTDTDAYVKIYDAQSGGVIVGNTVPKKILLAPGYGTAFQNASFNNIQMEALTAITIVCVTGLADNSTTAPSSGIYVEIFYRD